MADEYIKRDTVLAFASSYEVSPWGKERAVPIVCINSIPAEDVQPVVHWEWEILFTDETTAFIVDLCRCTNCGFSHKFIDKHYGQYNYCPQCGADMRSNAQVMPSKDGGT